MKFLLTDSRNAESNDRSAVSEPRRVLGTRIDPVDLPGTLEKFQEFMADGRAHSVHLVNSNNFVLAAKEPRYQLALNEGDLNIADGWPAVWGSRLLGGYIKERLSGPDLCHAVCQDGIERGLKHFFYGGTEESLAKLVTRVQERYSGIQVAGAYAPPFRPLTPEESDEVADRIDSSGAHLVWVGIGTPKQDFWIQEFAPRLKRTKILVAVGAAFDFIAGEKKRAPLWMQRSGLEWLHRLLSEPRRLWRRYLIGIPQFLFLFSKQLARERIFKRPQATN
jgi:N-acetylglucosaminyldiphosphoundecaprenol N-acetyl-beta-D-mannosaminyltransferase